MQAAKAFMQLMAYINCFFFFMQKWIQVGAGAAVPPPPPERDLKKKNYAIRA